MAILIFNGGGADDTYVAPLDIGNAYESAELRGYAGDDHLTGLVNDQNLIFGGLGDDTLVGGSLQNELHGDEGDDVLDSYFGSSGRLYGGTGNDFLIGSSTGNSTLDGGEGNDTMIGGKGLNVYEVDSAFDVVIETYMPKPGDPPNPLDTVRASVSYTLSPNVEALFLTGSDAIDGTGNGSANSLFGNTAANVLSGLNGNDTISASDGDDSLAGGKGNDLLTGGVGTDTVAGGVGNDVLNVASGADVVIELAGEGNDTVRATASYTLAEGVHVELLQLTGSSSINATGNSFGNLIAGNTGSNALDGGAGVDTVSFIDATGAITVNLGAGTATGQGSDTLASFERVFGSAQADTITGSAAADVLDGGAGIDSLTGGAGADIYVVNLATDVVVEGANVAGERDRVESIVTFTLPGNVEDLQLYGSVAVNGTGNTLGNVITGNIAANQLSGSSGDDTLLGGSGSDTLIGGIGADSMTGGNSADRYSIDHLGDLAIETGLETGDTVVVSINGYTLAANVENLELAGNARSGTGNSLANRLKGTDFNDTLDGGSGADTMDGGNGNDVYLVNSASDVVTELFTSSGTDEVRSLASYTLSSAQIERLTLLGTANYSGTGSSGNNVITGNSGNNTLSGGFGNDSLVGNDGNDVLRGGAGTDTIVGGNGTDIVQLDSASPTLSDLVTGFVSGTDDVRVSMGTATRIGDGDTLVEGAVTRAAANLFSSAAELVVFTSNIAGPITPAAAALKIGSATAAYTIGAQRLFVVDNGSSTAVFRFVAADADAAVETNELTLLATLSGTASTTTGDYLFGG